MNDARQESKQRFLAGGGELGELIRRFDWSTTSLGTPEAWPQSLRLALRIMLASRQPIWIGWGKELTYFYNDAYKSIIGGKHPWALGRPTTEVWREIWDDISPMLDTAMAGDQGTYVETQLLIMERNGYPEETYYTFSYSPIPSDDGMVGGIICANSDDTRRVIGERQLALLRDLATDTTHARSWQEVCEQSADALRTDARDIPFAMIYMAEPDGSAIKLACVSGIERHHRLAPDLIQINQPSLWPIDEVLRTQAPKLITNLKEMINSDIPTGPWLEPASQAAVLPILPSGETGRAGVLVVGLNPFRLFDDNYRSFLGLVAGQISAAIANAQAYEEERRRAEILLETARIRREATEALRARTAELEVVLETVPTAVWFTNDPEAAHVWGNRQAAELLRLPPDANPSLTAPEGERPRYFQLFVDGIAVAPRDLPIQRAARGDEVRNQELEIRFGDGTSTTILIHATPLRGSGGTVIGAVAAAVDITKRKAAEEILHQTNETLAQRVAAAIAQRAEAEGQLRHAQKMEAVGKLTGGVAHDFNNVLQVIGGSLQLLAQDIVGNLRAEQRLQTALAGISRGSKLASQLLAFGRRQTLDPKVINLGRLIRDIDDMLRRAIGEDIEIETVIAGGLWNTFIDAIQVENALLNLAINARDAMEGHGKLTIEAGNAFLDDVYVLRHAGVIPGQYVMIAVTDTGCGITPDIIEHVFEPFFTTKPEGQGTGLGLSMVYGFVKQSSGHIKIYSEPGQGTTVRIYLPRTREPEDLETDIQLGPATGGTETVLIAEDDEDVRNMVVDMLSELGYRVLKAKDAHSALVIIESGVPIDLLFTDVVMPGPLRSPELARKARERLPGIAILFTSGYTENAIVHGGRLDEGIDLLSKPYTRDGLARKIRLVLRNQQQRMAGKSKVPPAPNPATQ